MKIGLEHLGKTVNYNDQGSFVIEGFEKENGQIFIYGMGPSRGSRPTQPQHPNKNYYCIKDNGYIFDQFRLVEGEKKEFDYSVFGCNAEGAKDLVKHLDTKYVLKKKK